MALKQPARRIERNFTTHRGSHPDRQGFSTDDRWLGIGASLHRARTAAQTLTASDVANLQRAIGNNATTRLLVDNADRRSIVDPITSVRSSPEHVAVPVLAPSVQRRAVATADADGDGLDCAAVQRQPLAPTTAQEKTTHGGIAATEPRVNRAVVRVEARPTSIGPGPSIQRTVADTFVNGSRRGTGECGVGQGEGGVSHAEQRAWNQTKATVDAKFADVDTANVVVTFEVDQTICDKCQDWFESTIYPYLLGKSAAQHNKPFQLNVSVGGKTVRVMGAGETTWPKDVGDEERFSLVDQLKQKLIETGGFSDTELVVYKANGDTERIAYNGPAELEDTLRDHQEEIEASYDHWKDFQESGMVATGERGDIDFEEADKERNQVFESQRRQHNRR